MRQQHTKVIIEFANSFILTVFLNYLLRADTRLEYRNERTSRTVLGCGSIEMTLNVDDHYKLDRLLNQLRGMLRCPQILNGQDVDTYLSFKISITGWLVPFLGCKKSSLGGSKIENQHRLFQTLDYFPVSARQILTIAMPFEPPIRNGVTFLAAHQAVMKRLQGYCSNRDINLVNEEDACKVIQIKEEPE